MNLFTIDFECFFDRDYTLSKLNSSTYVRDERYQTHMVGIQKNGGAPVVLTDAQFRQLLPKLNLENSAVLCHHAQFDGLILQHHYGVRPKFFLDTLSMSRAVYPGAKSHSLKALAERLNLPPKGDELINTIGKRITASSPFCNFF